MSRQGAAATVEFGYHDGGLEHAVVQEITRRDVAALGGNQEQKRDRRAVAAVWQREHRALFETFSAMPGGALVVSQFRQHVGESLVRLGIIRGAAQSDFIMLGGSRKLAIFIERVGEIDVAHRIGGMAGGGFLVSSAGRSAIAGGM